MNTLQILELLKDRQELATDYQAAAFLGIKQHTISGWRRRGNQMSEEIAIKAAAGCGLPPALVLAWISEARAELPEVKEAWAAAAAACQDCILCKIARLSGKARCSGQNRCLPPSGYPVRLAA